MLLNKKALLPITRIDKKTQYTASSLADVLTVTSKSSPCCISVVLLKEVISYMAKNRNIEIYKYSNI